jgi:subtilisin family serine protease
MPMICALQEQPARRRVAYRAMALACVLACLAALILAPRPVTVASASRYRIDSTLRLLKALRSRGNVPDRLRPVVDADELQVSIRFQRNALLDALRLAEMERELGLQFTRLEGKIVSAGRVYAARMNWDALDRIAEWPGVERVDSIWKPAIAAPLDRSIDAIRADDVWALLDGGGWPVTGRGMVIAVFDTGVDVFHPDLWDAGGTYPWLDVNRNDRFDPGTDAVDLNRNGRTDASERLDLLDSGTAPGNEHIFGTDDGIYRTTLDWLFNDANGNGWRDYGPLAGYVEADTGYGERLFLTNDLDHDDILDVGEVLLSLDKSKVQRTLLHTSTGAEERLRGLNLITNPPDAAPEGHGTQVCGILAGGYAGLRRYVGVAPDSELLVAKWFDPQGYNRYMDYVPWAASHGADVMLYEFGSWVQEFLDGSSNLEQMLDAEAAQGIVQVAPAGNLAGGQKHAHVILSSGLARPTRFEVPSGSGITDGWISVLWRAPEDAVTVELALPLGNSFELPGNDTWLTVSGHSIWSYRERSPRGTTRFDITIDHEGAPLRDGQWTLRLRNNRPSWLDVHAYVSDTFAEWTGGITFVDNTDVMYTMTSPATADSAIAVASYSTRGRTVGVAGALSPFSSQGPRVDNESTLDLTAPGHYDIVCASPKDASGARPGQYVWFGGTSGAAAHAAGAAALILQKEPFLSAAQVTQRLQTAAQEDDFTGIVPNPRWGWGKLDVGAALNAPLRPTPTPRGRLLLPVILKDIAR